MKYIAGAIIKKYFKLLLSLAITASLGFALIAGLTSGYISLQKSLDRYLEDYQYPDAIISTEVTTISDASKLTELKGVEEVDTRLCANSMLKTAPGDYYSVRVFSYSEDENQDFYFWDRTDTNGEDSVLLEYHFAESHNINVGDTVSFRIRDEYRPFLVEGIVSRPETLYAKISDRAWGINYDFGFVYASIDLLAREYEKDSQKVKDELKENEETLDGELGSAQATLQEKENELQSAKELLESQKDLFNRKTVEAGEAQKQLYNARRDLFASIGELENKRKELNIMYRSTEEQKAQLLAQRDQLVQAKNGLDAIYAANAELDRLRQTLNRVENSGLIFFLSLLPQDISISDIVSFVEERIDGGAVDYPWETLFPETVNELRALLDSINNAISSFFPGKDLSTLTIGDILSRYKEIQIELASATLQLEEQKNQILSALSEYGIGEGEIDRTILAIDRGIEECDAGLQQIRDGAAQIDDGVLQMEAGIEEINATLLEIERQLAEAEQELSRADETIKSSEAELNRRAEEAMKEFADMEAELDRAYQKLNENEGYDHLCNQFLLYLDGNADAAAVLEQAKAVLSEELLISSSYIYEDSPVKARIDKNLKPLYSLAVYCPVVFYIVTLGIIFLFMSMIIKQSRREIGIFRALGFSRSKIRGTYCLISVLVALCGLVIGALLAFGILRYVGNYFKDFFPLPFFDYMADIKMGAIGAVATIAISLIATLITTGAISRILPKEAMSRPPLTKISIPAWIGRLTKNMKPINKFSLTSLLRGKGRFIFAAVCTAVSIMLIFAAVSFIAAKNHVIEQTFNERTHYDCQIFFEEVPDQELLEELRGLDYLSDIQTLLYYDTELPTENGSRAAIINAIEPDTSLISIFDSNGDPLSVRQGEIILERHLAKDLGVGEGDPVTVNGSTIRVGAVADQCANYTQYIALSDADRIGTPDLGCVICNIPEDKYSELLGFLTENEIDGYLYTIFTPPFFFYNIELYNTYDTGAWILIVFAIVIGFVIILNTMMTNLQELKHELCVLRSLGFSRGEISRSRFSQTILQFVIAVPIGLVSGYFFARTVLLQIGSEAEDYAFASGIKEYAVSVLIILAYLVISHFLTMRRMQKWSISENVKDKE